MPTWPKVNASELHFAWSCQGYLTRPNLVRRYFERIFGRGIWLNGVSSITSPLQWWKVGEKNQKKFFSGLSPRHPSTALWTAYGHFFNLLRPWSTVAQMNATKLVNVNQVIWRTQKVTSVVKGLTLHDKDKTMIPFFSVKTLTSLTGGFEWNEWIA